jgi:Putative transposase
VRVLSRLFRRLFLEHLQRAFDAGKLRFFHALENLRECHRFASYLAPARNVEWVVYAKRPFAGPEQVLDYVGRYTHRVAISNNRLLAIHDDQIRFEWKDYRHRGQVRNMTLSAEEFIRRFLLHVLPNGFRRIRYYGFLGNRDRQEKIDRCRRLLGMATPQQAAALTPDENRLAQYADIVGSPLHQCPQCRQGRMVAVDIVPKSSVTPARAIDSS